MQRTRLNDADPSTKISPLDDEIAAPTPSIDGNTDQHGDRVVFPPKSNPPSASIPAHEMLLLFGTILAAFTSTIAKNSLSGPHHTIPRTARSLQIPPRRLLIAAYSHNYKHHRLIVHTNILSPLPASSRQSRYVTTYLHTQRITMDYLSSHVWHIV